MKTSIETDSRSPPEAGGFITRAPTGANNDTAQPSLTSGFGAVIEKERDLQSATEGSVGRGSSPHSANLDRILQRQHSLLSTHIALLEERYEALPKPERFVNWNERTRPSAQPRQSPQHHAELLPDLVGQHTRLLADIDALIGCAPDGQRGELILTEVARGHEEMAWMLTALLKEDRSTKGIICDPPVSSSRGANVAEENDEGGPVRLDPLPAERCLAKHPSE